MGSVWYCCQCSSTGYGGMSATLCPACLYCGRSRCENCPSELIYSQEPGQKDYLYSNSRENRMFTESEALRGDYHNSGSLVETSQTFTERAPLPQTSRSIGDQVLCSYLDGSKVPLIHHSHNEPGPISGVGSSEISRSSLVFDRECTPRSCLETTDPSDSFSTRDTGFLFGGQCLNPRNTLVHQPDLAADFYDPEPQCRDELLLNTGGEEANELYLFDQDLEIGCANADAIPPQRHSWDEPYFDLAMNVPNVARLPGNFHQLAPWTQDFFAPPNAPCQLPNVELAAEQSKISTSLTPFSPSPPSHKGADRQHPARKGKTTQSVKACESCLSTAELDRKPLACPFFKFDPKEHFKCGSKEFSTISRLRQHLDRDHMLKEHDCKRCWASFKDEGSRKKHAGCQPMGGKPVNDLAPISKVRDTKHNIKWFWIWRHLYGENAPEPQCPYSHPVQDIYGNVLSNLCQSLEKKGNIPFTLDEVKEVASSIMGQAMAPNQSAIDR